jgi:hypothetical protein
MHIAALSGGDDGAGVVHYRDDRHARPRVASWDCLNANEIEVNTAGGEEFHL